MDVPAFLTTLQEVLEPDPSPIGLSTNVAIGVDDGDQRLWWNVRVGATVTQDIDEVPHPNVQAALLLGPEAAASVLATGTVPADADLVEVYGDAGVLEAFIDRHLCVTNRLDIRMPPSGDTQRSRRRRLRSRRTAKGRN